MELILLLLAVFPVRSMVIQGRYNYQEPNQSLVPGSRRPAAREPESFGMNTVQALFMKPSMGTSGIGRLMMEEMAVMKEFFGPGFDQPIGDIVNNIMHSTPDEIVHSVLDPIMSSPRSQETMGELERQFADFITSQLGEDVRDNIENEFLGGTTIASLIEYATGELPRITAFQFALQIMLQFQVQFASMMKTMTTTSLGELIQPITNMLGQLPNMTPGEVAEMLAEPLMQNDVNMGSVDEAISSFIRGMQNSPSEPSRPVNGDSSRNSAIRQSLDRINSEQADFARLNGSPQNAVGNDRCPAPESFGRQCFQYFDQCSSDNQCAQGQSCCLVADCGRECIGPQNTRPINGFQDRTNQQSFDRFNQGSGSTNQFGQQQNTPNFADVPQQDFDIPNPHAPSSQSSGRDTVFMNHGFGQQIQTPGSHRFNQAPVSSGFNQGQAPGQQDQVGTSGFGQPGQSSGISGSVQPSHFSGTSFQQHRQPTDSSFGSPNLGSQEPSGTNTNFQQQTTY